MWRRATARPGRTARLLLLLATLVGLAAMHTLGHGATAHTATTAMSAHAAIAMGLDGVAPASGESPASGAASATGATSAMGPASATGAAFAIGAASPRAAAFAMGPAPGSGLASVMRLAPGRGLASVMGSALLPLAADGAACPMGHCARALPLPARPGHGMDGWDVCVAVLTALGVLMVLIWLLSVATGRPSGRQSRSRAPGSSRAPPVRGLGLTLATVSVMRH